MSDSRSGYLVGFGSGLMWMAAEVAGEHQMLRAGIIAVAALLLAFCGAFRWEFTP